MRVRTGLIQELARADGDLWTEWMAALHALPGNPFGVRVVDGGEVRLLHVHGVPKPYYNRILGLAEEHHYLVDDALAFFSERRTPCRIDLSPASSGPRLLESLNNHGLRPVEFQSNLYADPASLRMPHLPPGVSVREVRPDELGFFCGLFERAYYGHRAPRVLARFRAASIRARATRPGWRFYLAFVDGVPAGGGTLYLRDGVATLAGGATIYTMRGRGCQKALLLRRMLDAETLGARLVVSRCVAGSVSQHNMQKLGLRLAYTKAIWQHPDA